MSNQTRALLREFHVGLERLYGYRLKGVYLFGSYARGEEDAESDVDMLVVPDDFARYGDEADRASELSATFSLK